MLYITSDNCYSCDEYEKVIQEIEEKTPFEIYYLKMDTNEEDTDIKQAVEELQITTGKFKACRQPFTFIREVCCLKIAKKVIWKRRTC